VLGSQSCTLSAVTLDCLTPNKLLGKHDKRRERGRSLDYETSLLIDMRTENIDNILGCAPNSGIQVEGCFSLLPVLKGSPKEVVQRQTEDHCSHPCPVTAPHLVSSWPTIGEELVKNINEGKETQRRLKRGYNKTEIGNRYKLKTRNILNRDRLASVQAMGLNLERHL